MEEKENGIRQQDGQQPPEALCKEQEARIKELEAQLKVATDDANLYRSSFTAAQKRIERLERKLEAVRTLVAEIADVR